MLQTVVEALRQIIGAPDFYSKIGNQTNYTWDYGAMLEYAVAAMVVLIVVGSVFRILRSVFER